MNGNIVESIALSKTKRTVYNTYLVDDFLIIEYTASGIECFDLKSRTSIWNYEPRKQDSNSELKGFAEKLEQTCIETVESGQMTKDLAILISKDSKFLNTEDFLSCIDSNLQKKLS